MTELQGLQSRYEDFHRRGAEVIAVSVDPVEKNAAVAADLELRYRVLADPELRAVDAYGLRHAGAGVDEHDIARPATFVIDEQGVIRWRNVTPDYSKRPTPDEVLSQVHGNE